MGLLDRAAPVGIRWTAALAVACAAVGLAAGVDPRYGLAASLGIAFTVAAIADLTVGVLVFTVLSFFEVLNTSVSGGATSFKKVAGLLLFLSWLASTVTASPLRRRTRIIPPAFIVAGVALLSWSALSVAWAESPGAAATSTSRYLINMLLIPIMLGAVPGRQHLLWVIGAFVFGAVVSTVYGIISPLAASSADFGRLQGSVGDPNEQAAVLVAAIAICLGLAGAMRHKPGVRLLALVSAVVCLIGVFNTLSRGGLIALAVMMLAAVFFAGRWRPIAAMLLLTAALGTVGYFVGVASTTARQRVSSGNTSGRSDVWKVGWRMVQAHPITGVGSGNFQVSAIHYLKQPGTIRNASLIADVPHVAHNIYLELLADLGVPGLLAFLAIVLASMASAFRAAAEFQRLGVRDLELIARCVLLALIGIMAADFFLSGEFSKQLWLLIALGPATLAIARSQAAGARR